MPGHIEKIADKKYRITLELGFNIKGKRIRKYLTKTTKEEAKRVLNEYNNQMYKSTFIAPDKISFGEWIQYWEENYVKNNCEATTYTTYKQIDNKYIIPCLGHIQLQNLNQITLDNYYKYLHDEVKLSLNTIEKHHANISSALKFAMKKQKVFQNVARLTTLPKANKEEFFEGQTLTIKQAINLMDYIKNNKNYQEIKIPIALAIFLGMSRGEIAGLKLNNIFDTYLVVEETRVKNGTKVIIKDPKAKGRKRALYIPSALKEYIKQQSMWVEHNKLLYKQSYVDSGYICVKENGEPYNPQYITRRFKQLLKDYNNKHEEKLPIIRFHDLRHTNITVLIEEDVNIYDVSKHAGHSNINTTMGYTHLLDENQKKMANKIDQIFNK